ncbi:Tat pathway signal sequence domain protein [Streptomyces longwoodensis]|uniref:Tat pathway signal sequence domain protein n=1 Tax=Streptomyces longwoodensis TaxID=68231 RepID=UPI0036F513ED
MNAIGPVEPGEGTAVPRPAGRRPVTGRDRHPTPLRRRPLAAALTAALVLAAAVCLYATRPDVPPPAPPAPPTPSQLPFPAQVVDVTFVGPHVPPPGAAPQSFAFEVLLSVDAGPEVTVTRVSQPYAGMSVATTPRTPFRTRAGAARTIVITLHVTECETVPENDGLPFLDVTLRNTRAIQEQSFILGPRYARALSRALQVACSNDSG